MQQSTYDRAIWLYDSVLEGKKDFSSLNFSQCQLDKLKLRPDSKLNYSIFTHCSLAEVKFSGASLIAAIFDQANLRSAVFEDAIAPQASFMQACLIETVWNHASLINAVFRDANLQDAAFAGADICGADFRGANLEGANFADALLNEKTLFDFGIDLQTLGLNTNTLAPKTPQSSEGKPEKKSRRMYRGVYIDEPEVNTSSISSNSRSSGLRYRGSTYR